MHWKKVSSWLLIVFLLTGILALAGCGKTEPAKSAAKTLRAVSGAEPETVDPRKAIGQPESIVMKQMFEGLCTQDQKGNPIPGTAERWDISPDGLKYKFHLRANAKWANGDPVTAHDFEYTWKSVLSPELGSKYADQLYYIKNGEAYNKRKISADQVGIKALDDRTLEVTLERPTPYFLFLTTFFTYLPVHKKTVEANPNWNADPKTIIGNGPFKMTSWVHNSKIEMVKSDTYWNKGVVKTEKLELYLSDNRKTVADMFDNKQIDTADLAPPPSEYARLMKDGTMKTMPFISVYHYMFNVTKPPLDNPKVRKALALAVNRQAIIDHVAKGGEKPSLAWIPYGLPDARPGEDFRKTGGDFFKDNDIETARKLLAEAGYPDGKGFPTLSMLYNTSDLHKAIAEAIQEMWKKNLGINVTLLNQEWKVYLQSRATGDFELARREWIGDYLDPMTNFDMMTSKNGNNNTRWGNAKYDELIDIAKRSMDPNVRMQAMHEAEKILMDEMPFVPIYFGTNKFLEKPNVKGAIRDALGSVYYREAYVE